MEVTLLHKEHLQTYRNIYKHLGTSRTILYHLGPFEFHIEQLRTLKPICRIYTLSYSIHLTTLGHLDHCSQSSANKDLHQNDTKCTVNNFVNALKYINI